MDASTGWCRGCLRTLEEIAAWGNADEAFKRHVWFELEARALRCDVADER
jgi:predicted Fe-S protein YdhL (DUF1289 family)